MLDVHSFYLGLLPRLARTIAAVALQDADLARQLRRASASVALNFSEGYGSTKGTRRARFESALGSLRETIGGVDVALAFGYVSDRDIRQDLDRVAAMTWRLLHPRR